jgi:hypothetical protein
MKKECASDAKKDITTAEEFDRRFEAGEDISELVDWEAAHHTGLETRRLTVDFPSWMVAALHNEVVRLGVSSQALIKFIINSYLRPT